MRLGNEGVQWHRGWGEGWIVDWGPVCGAIMGFLSAPQRVEILSGGGAVENTIMGVRGCAAGELDLGPGGRFTTGWGPAARDGGWCWGAGP